MFLILLLLAPKARRKTIIKNQAKTFIAALLASLLLEIAEDVSTDAEIRDAAHDLLRQFTKAPFDLDNAGRAMDLIGLVGIRVRLSLLSRLGKIKAGINLWTAFVLGEIDRIKGKRTTNRDGLAKGDDIFGDDDDDTDPPRDNPWANLPSWTPEPPKS